MNIFRLCDDSTEPSHTNRIKHQSFAEEIIRMEDMFHPIARSFQLTLPKSDNIKPINNLLRVVELTDLFINSFNDILYRLSLSFL